MIKDDKYCWIREKYICRKEKKIFVDVVNGVIKEDTTSYVYIWFFNVKQYVLLLYKPLTIVIFYARKQ